MKNQSLLFPENRPLIGTTTPSLPFVIVGDEAFPLLPNLMRPFPAEELSKEKKIFNYRLSRARRVVENAFGILSSRFRCFRRPITVKPKNAVAIVKGAVMLHNFLRKECGIWDPRSNINFEDNERNIYEAEWQKNAPKNQMVSMTKHGGRQGLSGIPVRQQFLRYFNSNIGSIPWQEEYVNRLH